MIEIDRMQITLENAALDERQANAVVTRALELLENHCNESNQWNGRVDDMVLPPMELNSESLSNDQLSEQMAAEMYATVAAFVRTRLTSNENAAPTPVSRVLTNAATPTERSENQ